MIIKVCFGTSAGFLCVLLFCSELEQNTPTRDSSAGFVAILVQNDQKDDKHSNSTKEKKCNNFSFILFGIKHKTNRK